MRRAESTLRRVRELPWTLAATVALSAAAPAQDLQERVEELEQRNTELEGRLADVEAEQALGAAEAERYSMGVAYGDVDVTFQMFGDVGGRYLDPAMPSYGNSSFFIGMVDFFVTAKIGEHFQVLSETVISSAPPGTDKLGQERLWGAYTFNDLLYAKVGLEHTPISRWNRQYHHGAWLEPTITRPLLAGFEGQADAFLPMHNSGLELGGRTELDTSHLEYVFILSNGRGRLPSDKQKVADGNNDKGVVLSLDWVFPGSGTRLGVAAQIDEAPDTSATPALAQGTEGLIGSAYVQIPLGPLDTWAEVVALQNKTTADGETYNHLGAFLQFLWPLSEDIWTPYLRLDVKDMEEDDPYLAQKDRDLDQVRTTLGVRYDFASQAALKLETNFGQRDERDSGGVISGEDFVAVAFQLAWWI